MDLQNVILGQLTAAWIVMVIYVYFRFLPNPFYLDKRAVYCFYLTMMWLLLFVIAAEYLYIWVVR